MATQHLELSQIIEQLEVESTTIADMLQRFENKLNLIKFDISQLETRQSRINIVITNLKEI